MSGTSFMVATTALVGYALADDKIYASLPFTLQLIAIPAVIGIIISLVWLYKIDKITHVQPDSEMID